jgi:four helix bundle protein
MDFFELAKPFPLDERYSLASQIRRPSRSVAANITEGFWKRQYPNVFASKLAHSDATDTQVWLEFASRCGYLSEDTHSRLVVKCEELGRMIGKMMESPERFLPSEVGCSLLPSAFRLPFVDG